MNPIAKELNQDIESQNPHILAMLSSVGKNLFFPKGILSQSAEAKEKGHKFNATIGIATQMGKPMTLDCVTGQFADIAPEKALTYASTFGLTPLKEAWQEAQVQKNPSLQGKAISEPVVTHALTHGLCVFGEMFIDPGDVILMPSMYWGNYNLIFTLRRQAKIVTYPIFTEAGGFNVQGLDKALKEVAAEGKKVVVMLNFPQNPSGYTVNEAEAKAIEDTLVNAAELGANIVALSDDAYFGLFYSEECIKESLFARLAGRHPRILAVKLDGGTKEDFVWGLRVGFLTYGAAGFTDARKLYDALEKKTAGCVRGTISSASHLSQTLMLEAMRDPQYAAQKKEKRDIMAGRAKAVMDEVYKPQYADAWEVYPFNSGYFMCLKLKTVDAEKLRVHLLENYGVGLISMGETDLRVAFSCVEIKDIPELYSIIYKGIKDLEAE